MPFLCFSQTEKPEIHFHQLPVHELSSPIIQGIHQDQNGFMWFSAVNGLNKYDGREISIHHPFLRDSIKRRGYNIKALHEDENGIFWIPTWHGFSRFDPANGKFTIYKDSDGKYEMKGPNMVLSVFEDSKQRIWLGTHLHSLHQFDPVAEHFIKQYPYLPRDKDDGYSLSHKRVEIIWEDQDGMIWLRTKDFLLNRLDPETGRIEKFDYPPFLEDPTEKNKIQVLRKDQFGHIWIRDKEHLYYWEPLKGKYETYTFPENFDKTLDVNISHIHKDRSGIIWMATNGGGLKRWNPDKGTLFSYNHIPNNNQSLQSDVIKEIYEDRNGLIWLATPANGVLYFDPKSKWFKHYKHDPRLPNSISGNLIKGISSNGKNKIWIAEQNAKKLNLFDPVKNTFSYHNPLLATSKGNFITCIYESPKEPGVLWAGYPDTLGLDRWDMKKGTRENFSYNSNDSTGLSSNQVLSIYEDRKGLLWFTSQWGLTSLDRRTMTFSKYLTDKEDSTSISHNSILSIYEDGSGDIWVGTMKGLNKLDRKTGKFRRYLHDSSNSKSISATRINCIFEDSRGMLWIGCSNGLNLMDRSKETFTHFSNLINLPSDNYWKMRDQIKTIEEDDGGRLWIGTSRGFSILSEINDEGFNITHIDLLGDEFLGGNFGRQRNAFHVNEDGNWYFGNKNGLFVITPDQWKMNSLTAPLVFTDFKIANEAVQVTAGPITKSINFTEHIDLSYKDDIITFEFSLLDYKNPQLHQYAYRLEGFKEEWINIGNQREVTFTNLDAGDYTLHVKAADENGQWNEQQAEISFTIIPAWWQTRLFRWGGFLLLIGLIVAFFTWRNRSIKKQNVRLQEKVEDRTKELSITLKNLKTTQSELVQSEKMALLGTLIAGVAHEVNNPLGAVSASNSNIIESTKFLKENFPKIFQILNPEQQNLYLDLIDQIPQKHNHITGKERRQLKKQLTEQLERSGLLEAETIAETLIEIGVTENFELYYPLFKLAEYELILDSVYHSAQLQNNSSNIKIATDRASKIVYALRSYSHNYEPDTRVSVNVSETIDNVLVLFHNTIKRGVEVQKNYQSVSPISANPDELQQVWTNIIQNALQAMKFKGNLFIDIEQRDQQVVVSIIDNGPGIDPSIQEKIFEPLSTTKAPGEGSGLGLHICQRIIHDHKGEITFDSEPGKTTFSVWLPVG